MQILSAETPFSVNLIRLICTTQPRECSYLGNICSCRVEQKECPLPFCVGMPPSQYNPLFVGFVWEKPKAT